MPIRVLICGMPRLLAELVSEILAAQPDVVVVARLDAAAEPLAVVRALEPDVVILQQQQEGAPGQADHAPLLAARRGLRVIAISGGGRRGSLHRHGAGPATLGKLSAAGLLRAVRGAAPRRPRHPRRRDAQARAEQGSSSHPAPVRPSRSPHGRDRAEGGAA